MTEFEKHVELVKNTLAKAVADALERKWRLGQYAVIMRDGKPYKLSPAEIKELLKEGVDGASS